MFAVSFSTSNVTLTLVILPLDSGAEKRSLLRIVFVAFFDEGAGAYDVEGLGVAAGGFEGDAHGGALPLGGLADGDEVVGLGPGGELLEDGGLACAELGDDGEEASLGGGGDAAVGGVVAVPDDGGDDGVEVGKVEGGDAAGDAVDEQPGAGLPEKAGLALGGEGVVEVEDAADGEGAVGDFVELAGGPLALGVVDEKGADGEGGGVFAALVGGGVGRGVGNFARGAESDGVEAGVEAILGGLGRVCLVRGMRAGTGRRAAEARERGGRSAWGQGSISLRTLTVSFEV